MESEPEIKKNLNVGKEEIEDNNFTELSDNALSEILNSLDNNLLLSSKLSIIKNTPEPRTKSKQFWPQISSENSNKFDKKNCIAQIFPIFKKEVKEISKSFMDFFTIAQPYKDNTQIKCLISSKLMVYKDWYDFYRTNYMNLLNRKILPKAILVAAITKLFEINKVNIGSVGQTLLHLVMTDWDYQTVGLFVVFDELDKIDQFGNTPRKILEQFVEQCMDGDTLTQINEFDVLVNCHNENKNILEVEWDQLNPDEQDKKDSGDMPACLDGTEDPEVDGISKFTI